MSIIRRIILFEPEAYNWLDFKKNTIKNSTFYKYKYLLEKYILTYFKGKTIYYFKNYNFNIYIKYLSNTLSSKTIIDILSILKSILKYIGRKNNIEYKLDLIAIPRQMISEIEVLSDNEKVRLEKYCVESKKIKNIGIIICLNTGLRLGEICALTWNDIDLRERLIVVNKTIQRIYKGKNNTIVQIDTPKTRKSNRKIPISNKLMQLLQNIKHGNNYNGEEYVLTGSNKIYMEPRNYQRNFKRCLIKCGIHNYNFHILRHTFATNCIKIGMDVKSLSEILGHANVSITLNKYVHSSFNVQRKFLNRL